MKIYQLLITSLLLSTVGLAQRNYTGIFSATDINDHIIHADGIHRFFLESDMHLKQGNMEEAILVLDGAIMQNPNIAEIYVKRAQQLGKLGRYTEAQRDLREAYRLNPYVADFLQVKGQPEKIKWIEFPNEEYEDFVDISAPEHIAPLIKQGLAKKVAGDLIGALVDIELAIFSVENPPAKLFSLLGNINLLMEDYSAAIHSYGKAIDIAPETGYFYFNRAVAKIFDNQRSSACDDLEKSSRLGYIPSQEKLKHFCYY